jgi:hypothetical protein
MATGWMVYRCETHKTTTYVNANPRHGAVAAKLCCPAATLVDVADENQFYDVLRAVAC